MTKNIKFQDFLKILSQRLGASNVAFCPSPRRKVEKRFTAPTNVARGYPLFERLRFPSFSNFWFAQLSRPVSRRLALFFSRALLRPPSSSDARSPTFAPTGRLTESVTRRLSARKPRGSRRFAILPARRRVERDGKSPKRNVLSRRVRRIAPSTSSI